MSSTQSPFYGGNFVFKMKTPLYLQLFNDTYNTQKTTGALQLAEFEGTKAKNTMTLTADLAADKYFTFDSPTNKFVFYTGTKPSVTGANFYISIGAGGTWTIDSEAAAIIAAIAAHPYAKNEITTTFTTPTLVLDAVQGGYTDNSNATGTSGWTIVDTLGEGEWVKVGVLKEEWSLNPEIVEVATSEKTMIKLADKYAPEFKLMNVDPRAREIIVNNFSNKSVNFGLIDKTNAFKPTMILHNIPLQDLFDLSGDTGELTLKGSKEYSSSGSSILTNVCYWMFDA